MSIAGQATALSHSTGTLLIAADLRRTSRRNQPRGRLHHPHVSKGRHTRRRLLLGRIRQAWRDAGHGRERTEAQGRRVSGRPDSDPPPSARRAKTGTQAPHAEPVEPRGAGTTVVRAPCPSPAAREHATGWMLAVSAGAEYGRACILRQDRDPPPTRTAGRSLQQGQGLSGPAIRRGAGSRERAVGAGAGDTVSAVPNRRRDDG
jgi:hypothetical protein